jgi:hypothetical protein
MIPSDDMAIQNIPETVRDKILTELNEFNDPRLTQAIKQYRYALETLQFSPTNENIHYILDNIQRFHPELDITKIYSIYY